VRTLTSWVAFGAAIASFSKLWVGVRTALEGERLYGPLQAILWMVLFLVSMGYLAFAIYAADRAAGRTRRSMPLFDRWLDRPRSGRPRAEAAREP
jgi:hypothetical protein